MSTEVDPPIKTFEEKNIAKADGTTYNIYTDGLKIHTTIDLAYQKHAEKAVFDHMFSAYSTGANLKYRN